MGRRIRKGAGAEGVSVLEAVLTMVRGIDPRKSAVFTPYTEDLTNNIASSLREAGYPPVKAAGMGIRGNLDIVRVPASELIRFVESQLKACSPDCVFLSCTNSRSVEAIEPLRRTLGIPLVTSNHAA